MKTQWILWIDGNRRGHYDEGHLTEIFAQVNGRGTRITLPVIRRTARFLESAYVQMETFMAIFGCRFPDICVDLELWIYGNTGDDQFYELEILAALSGPVDQMEGTSTVFQARLSEPQPAELKLPCVSAMTSPWIRLSQSPLAGLPLISGMERRQLLLHAESRGCEEGLWINERDHAVEFCWGSLMWVLGSSWFVPALGDNPTWNPVINEITGLLSLNQCSLSADELPYAELVVRIASTGKFSVIANLDNRPIPVRSHSVYELREAVTQLLRR